MTGEAEPLEQSRKIGAGTITARATDGTGVPQVEPFTLPQPDGGTG